MSDGRGVALGIDINVFLKYRSLLEGNDIIYDKKKQINLLDNKISSKVLDNLENAIVSQDENDFFSKSRIMISYILKEAVMCKNPAFQEEKEYRISCKPIRNKTENVSGIKFRTNNESILPYIEIDFKDIRHSLIKNITVGPKSKINNRNLWLFLQSHGFMWKELDKEWSMSDSKWKRYVKISEATYR